MKSQWSKAFEFRQRYNDKVKDTINQFYNLLNSNSISLQTKIDSLADLGIFCIPLLLNELDSTSSSLDKQSIIYSIEIILNQYNGSVIDNFDAWKNDYEEDYRNIIEILK